MTQPRSNHLIGDAASEARRDYRLWHNFALLTILLHCLFLTRYGIFRDELYYLACADHPAWGYVDQPPLSIGILWLSRALLGDSLWAIRLLPTLALSGVVWLTGWLTHEAGGKRIAQAFAMLAALIAPVYLAIGHYFSMNAFDVLLWTASFCVLLRILQMPQKSLWLWLGVLLGLGLLNKLSILWLMAGIVIGLVSTPYRRILLTPGPWLAGLLAGAISTPHFLWQMANHWPTLEFIHNATAEKMSDVSPVQFVLSQILTMNPVTAPLWLTGLVWALLARSANRWRVPAIAFLVIALILIINGRSRAEYLSPLTRFFFAIGATVWERWEQARQRSWQSILAFGVLSAGGLAIMPLALPVLPVPMFIRYQRALYLHPPQEEKGAVSILPQHYADMHGWQEIASAVARVYHNLPSNEQSRCAILASNYGEAGAIDYFGKRYGLPHALSGHNNYWLWGAQNWDGQNLIVINTMSPNMQRKFGSVRQAAIVPNTLGMPYEQNLPIYVAHGLKMPVAAFWNTVKHYR